ncbi:MAG: MASE3 domain-containing protein [Spirochaetia bacterium]
MNTNKPRIEYPRGLDEGRRRRIAGIAGKAAAGLAILAGLYGLTIPNYLLFHSIAELFSIIIAAGVFMIAWNSRRFADTGFLNYLGIAYLSIAVLDILHTLGYKGMNIFLDYDYYANQLWIAARYVESISLLVFISLKENKRKHPKYGTILGIYGAVTAALIASIFGWRIFPECYVEGEGQTTFKLVSEFIISGILLASVLFLIRRRRDFDRRVFRFIFASIILTILSEIAFTFYFDNYGIANFIGHVFKIGSFYLIYKAIIETSLQRPMDIIFRELSTLNAEKDKFFSIIAHDLKNPFSGIQSMSEILRTEYDELTESEKREYIGLIAESAKLSLDLLDNLLVWARMQTGRMTAKPETFPAGKAVWTAAEIFKTPARKKRIRIETDLTDDAEVYADRNMVDLILRNLLSNAVKFTYSGGHIRITTRRAGEELIIRVEDTGTGIEEKDLEKLFSLGESISRPGTASEHGTGLGLLLCKEFAERNGGRLWATSVPGGGSVFSVSLPLAG